MNPSNLPLPLALQNLLESGFWPTTEKESQAQHSKPLVPSQRVRSFAPEEDDIFFYAPPFRLVSHCIKHGEQFWSWPMSASHEINPDLTLLIGDFGLGSDAPFALDYSRNLASPRVIRLLWGKSVKVKAPFWKRKTYRSENHWVEVAPDFETFALMLAPTSNPPL